MQSTFQFYKSGIMTGACGTELNHAVVIVGYGTTSAGEPFWKVQNQWGTGWGNSGFILLPRNTDSVKYNGNRGQCGLYMQPLYPTL